MLETSPRSTALFQIGSSVNEKCDDSVAVDNSSNWFDGKSLSVDMVVLKVRLRPKSGKKKLN